MPLQAALPGLILDIEKAFDDKRKAMEALPEHNDASRDAINKKFYIALASAIHKYTMQAQVVAMGGGPVTGVAAPVPTPVGSAAVIAAAVVTTSGNLL